jgi:aldose 1-epimerase
MIDELRFSSADLELVLLPGVGGRLHRLRAFGHDLLRTPADPATHLEEPFSWGAYPMAPWCNRIDPGPVDVAGRTVALPSNFPDGSAIHGQLYSVPWEVVGDGDLRANGGWDGWPWPYRASLHVEVADASIRLEYSLENLGDAPMPAGLGIHPWFRRPVHVAVPARSVYADNTATEPRPRPVTPPFDLRMMGPMADDLDATWTDLDAPRVDLSWPETGLRARMTVASPDTHIVAASPAHLDSVAIEPQTHAPQGVRRLLNGEPGPLRLLDPSEVLRLEVGLSFARPGTPDQRIPPP